MQVHSHEAPTRDKARPETKAEKIKFNRARKAEAIYARQLRGVARHIGEIVRAMAPAPGDMAAASLVRAALDAYSKALRPWATVASARMIADVSRRDEAIWFDLQRQMGKELRREIKNAPTGHMLRGMLAENVDLITSLPTQAAARVHRLTLSGLSEGNRAEDISREIMRTGHVTQGRAMLIARTEVARTASGLTEVRSLHVGSEGYIWRTAEDSDVRNQDGNPVGSHRLLNGKFIRWDSPPVASTSGERAHAGQIYNCRCYPEPVIPEELH